MYLRWLHLSKKEKSIRPWVCILCRSVIHYYPPLCSVSLSICIFTSSASLLSPTTLSGPRHWAFPGHLTLPKAVTDPSYPWLSHPPTSILKIVTDDVALLYLVVKTAVLLPPQFLDAPNRPAKHHGALRAFRSGSGHRSSPDNHLSALDDTKAEEACLQ